MREKKKTDSRERPAPRGLDGIPSDEPGARMATVSHGPYAEALPVGGMSVRQIRRRFADRFDIDAASSAIIDGAAVDDDTILQGGQVLSFVRHAGEKGSGLLNLQLHDVRPIGRTAPRPKPVEEAPTVTIEGETASVTSPEGQRVTLPFERLLEQLLDRRMNTGEVILPEGVRWVTSAGRMSIWVHETSPRVHRLKWIASDSPARYGRGARYREVSLALPYLIVFAVFVPRRGEGMLIGDANECFFRTEPLTGLDDGLSYPALLNCSKFDPAVGKPLSWICTQHLDRNPSARLPDENARMHRGLKDLLHCTLESGFNYSSEEHEASSWFTESRNVDPRISTVENWEKASAGDPLFVLDVPWLPVKLTVRQVAERIALNCGAATRDTPSSSHAARAIYNHGSTAKSALGERR